VIKVAVETLAAEGVGGFTARRVANAAATSTPAVYELFGDKAGLVREVFFEGFWVLRRYLEEPEGTSDCRAALARLLHRFRLFVRDNPVLAQVMFSRPFTDFDPGPDELAAGAAVRELVVDRVQRCIDAGVVSGDPVDIAHVVLALAQGMAAQETAGWLGRSGASVNRRWGLAIDGMLDGLRPPERLAGRRRQSRL
jgi:AcrR family transcriptional regulator